MMQMAFHMGAHGTDGDRLLKTLLNNRSWLMANATEVVPPPKHRGIFDQALMALNGGPATEEMQQIMLDALLELEAPERVVFSSASFLGGTGRIFTSSGLYPMIGTRTAALANLFPQTPTQFFIAIRNPVTMIAEMVGHRDAAAYRALLNGADPVQQRWGDCIRRLVRAAQGRRVVVWCHEDVPMVWPEVVRLVADMPAEVPLAGSLLYMHELLGNQGLARLRGMLAGHDQMSIQTRREIYAAALADHAGEGALDQEITLPGWSQDLVDQVTELYRNDAAEIAVQPGVEFILP